MNGAGRDSAERARLRLSFRSEAFAQSPASLRGGGGCGGGGGGGGGSGGEIRKSTPCRVCTRAGEEPPGPTSQASAGHAVPFDLRGWRGGERMWLGIGTSPLAAPQPLRGLKVWGAHFPASAVGLSGGTEPGHLSCPSVLPLLSLSPAPWILSPGVFLLGLDARSRCTPQPFSPPC